ncbi:ArsR family transcriptional regulator [Sphingomonas qilianensis]|uniref:ArsR family transcriptional regulator n=1 Tax=Sphingomonas qilianensis TaxID=1736690 RepID=A0ABU9XP11_9SPHN
MADAGEAGLPIRLITRLLAEMLTSIARAGIEAFGGDLDRFGIFALIMVQSGLRGPGATPSPMSTNALATCLSRPFETVRRHVNAMIAEGLCVRTNAGVIVSPDCRQRPAIAALLVLTHDAFVRMTEDLIAFDQPVPAARGTPYDPDVAVRGALEMLLAVADGHKTLHRCWTSLALFYTSLCGAMRDVTDDPVLARVYADATMVVPEGLCRPVRASALARALGLPYSTVQRRMAAIVAEGRAVQVRGGVLPVEARLNTVDARAVSRLSLFQLRRVLGVAAAGGFPFDDPASVYLHGRPARLRIV